MTREPRYLDRAFVRSCQDPNIAEWMQTAKTRAEWLVLEAVQGRRRRRTLPSTHSVSINAGSTRQSRTCTFSAKKTRQAYHGVVEQDDKRVATNCRLLDA